MQQAFHYLAQAGVLTALMWVPYILSRMHSWGIRDFLNNYPDGFPAAEPAPPLWAQRAKRAHLNMVETLPAFIAVVVAASYLADDGAAAEVGRWAMIFYYARVAHYIVYSLGIPYLRTPAYLVSWAAILMIGTQLA
ncbi:MAPEG family protein [Sphingopyxis sp. XHP0097]|uniref:MAPEG family protein n=1 Tax=Sphingopyxis jiangsuensis TaxID=2871171 RepID=A0ABS7MFY2_9SPHN|nr:MULTISPECIES: MAPEG family protein [Sphingopyxis]MBY4637656.1 MAPEG family protein [Sphingopyxis jiangsuensis]